MAEHKVGTCQEMATKLARTMKGKGIVQRILNILEGIPFGKLFFEVAKILRSSLLLSILLCNSEAWLRVSKPELELLESVDLMLLRRILEAPKTTPKVIRKTQFLYYRKETESALIGFGRSYAENIILFHQLGSA